MLIRLHPDSAAPLHQQIAASIRACIVEGSVADRERLPAARLLAESLGINVHTVLHAYQQLRDEGLIELRRGRGAVVSGLAEAERVRAVSILDEAVQRIGELGVPPEAAVAMFRQRLQVGMAAS